MITSHSYSRFAHNKGHHYLIFSRNNIFLLIPTLHCFMKVKDRKKSRNLMGDVLGLSRGYQIEREGWGWEVG